MKRDIVVLEFLPDKRSAITTANNDEREEIMFHGSDGMVALNRETDCDDYCTASPIAVDWNIVASLFFHPSTKESMYVCIRVVVLIEKRVLSMCRLLELSDFSTRTQRRTDAYDVDE